MFTSLKCLQFTRSSPVGFLYSSIQPVLLNALVNVCYIRLQTLAYNKLYHSALSIKVSKEQNNLVNHSSLFSYMGTLHLQNRPRSKVKSVTSMEWAILVSSFCFSLMAVFTLAQAVAWTAKDGDCSSAMPLALYGTPIPDL